MPTGSRMLMLDRERGNTKMLVLQAYILTYLSIAIASLFMKEDCDPLFMESR